jgi:hypothetical protein
MLIAAKKKADKKEMLKQRDAMGDKNIVICWRSIYC